MKIEVAKNIGFCSGVNYTIKKIYELLNSNNTLYCLGNVVHNETVVNDLNKKGLITINSIEDAPNNSTVIIRTHGETYTTYLKAKDKKINVIDLTCGRVLLVHKKVESHKDDSFIIIIGKPNHTEIIGTKSYAGINSIVVDTIDDIKKSYDMFLKSNINNVYICAQTTYSLEKYNELLSEIKNEFKGINIDIDNTICDSTKNRQDEVDNIAKNNDILLVVGSKTSSNTTELYNRGKKHNDRCYMVNAIEDLENIKFNSNSKIGIVSGASTSMDIVNIIIKYLENME